MAKKKVFTQQQQPTLYKCTHCKKDVVARTVRFHQDNCKEFNIKNFSPLQLDNYKKQIPNQAPIDDSKIIPDIIPDKIDVTDKVNQLMLDNPDLLDGLPEKVTMVLTSLAESLEHMGCLTSGIQPAVMIMAQHLADVENHLIGYSRAIHIGKVQEAFEQTQNSGLAKLISDLLNFQTNVDDLDITLVNFKDLPEEYLRGYDDE